jgi:predicted metal-binding protein
MICYIIRDKSNNLFKIGRCTDFKKRFSTLSTSNLYLESLFILNYVTESYLHKTYKSKRISKEWFKLDKQDLLDILELEEELFKQTL